MGHQYQIVNWDNQPGQPCPHSPSEQPVRRQQTDQWSSRGRFALPQATGKQLFASQTSQNALFYKTHFVLVLPDGSCGQQKAQEEAMDRAGGNAQAKVKGVGKEGGYPA